MFENIYQTAFEDELEKIALKVKTIRSAANEASKRMGIDAGNLSTLFPLKMSGGKQMVDAAKAKKWIRHDAKVTLRRYAKRKR